jgi:excisionase family DNA binding protein
MRHSERMLNNLLTTEQAAERLGKHVATINRWALEGKLVPAFQAPGVRGARMFPHEAVNALVDDEAGIA